MRIVLWGNSSARQVRENLSPHDFDHPMTFLSAFDRGDYGHAPLDLAVLAGVMYLCIYAGFRHTDGHGVVA